MRLPPELRDIIWNLALPRRLITPRAVGGVYAPAAPALAQACRESRAVALRHGSPRSFDHGRKRGSTAWYDPWRDVVLWAGTMPSHSGREHPVCGSIWANVASVAVDTRYACPAWRWAGTVFNEDSVATLRRVSILGSAGYHAGGRWDPGTDQAVFGNASVALVDLRDAREVTRIRGILYGGRGSRGCGQALTIAAARAGNKNQWWVDTVAAVKLEWLKANYTAETLHEPGSGGPAPVKVSSQGWDDDNEWIKATLGKLPEIRHAFMIRKKHEDLLTMKNRSRGCRYPGICWADGKWCKRS